MRDKLCKDCEHFKIDYEPYYVGGECWDFGQASCTKHDLVTPFRSKRKFKTLKCVERREP